jgi:hypothetical protein
MTAQQGLIYLIGRNVTADKAAAQAQWRSSTGLVSGNHGRQADSAKSSREALWTRRTMMEPTTLERHREAVAERTRGVKADGAWLRITGNLAVSSLAAGAD